MLRLVRLLLLLFSFSFSHNFGLLSYGVSLLAFRVVSEAIVFVVLLFLGTLSAFIVSVCVMCLWFLSLYWPPF